MRMTSLVLAMAVTGCGSPGAERGQPISGDGGPDVVITSHPSAVLRTQRGPEHDEAFAGLVTDLRTARAAAAG